MKKIIRWLRSLTRPQKIACNAALTLLLLVPAILLMQWPAWRADTALRRLTGQFLLDPYQVVRRVQSDRSTAYLLQGEGWTAAVRVDIGVLSTLPDASAYFTQFVPLEDTVVLALPWCNPDRAMTAAAWTELPEAVSARLELTLEKIKYWDKDRNGTPMEPETFTAQVSRGEDGWFLFTLTPHPEEEICIMEAQWTENIYFGSIRELPYRLTLLDSQGQTLETITGTLPPEEYRSAGSTISILP